MILDPINAITSVNFYRRVAGQRARRTFAYLIYVSFLFAIAATVAVKVRLAPEIDDIFVWLAQSMPPLTVQAGKVTSTAPAPVTLRYPKVPEIALTVDTTRVDPVTPDMLDANKALGYLTSNALYVRSAGDRIETYDLSKDVSTKPVVVDAAFYQNASKTFMRLLYPLTLFFGFLFTVAWKLGAGLLYTMTALMINAMVEGGQPFAALFNIAAYAQTLIIALEAIFLFMPVGIPAFPAIAFFSTGVYTWLAIKRLQEPPAVPAS